MKQNAANSNPIKVSSSKKWWRLLPHSFLMGGTLLLFPACDALVTYKFQVQNSSSKSVNLHVQTPQSDTHFVIAPSAQQLIYERSQVNSGVKPYFAEQDTIWWFLALEAMNSDSVSAAKELRIAGNWEFSKEQESKAGLYLLKLQDSDF